jgi:hypothetical protein
MSVMFELKPNARHAAKQRRGFLRFFILVAKTVLVELLLGCHAVNVAKGGG